MLMRKGLLIILPIFLLVSCTKTERETIFVTAEEILQDANSKSSFKEKYKKRDVVITGVAGYIGVPKDNPTKKDTTYISIAEDDKTVVLVYFDFFVNQFVKKNQAVKVKCIFRKYDSPTFYYDGNFIEFKKGELIEVADSNQTKR